MSFLRALLSAAASGAAAGGVRPPPLEEGKPVTIANDRDTVLLNAAAQRIARGRGDEGEQTPDELQAFSALTPSEQLAKVEEELEQLPPRQRREVMDLLGKWLGRKFIPNPGPQAQAYHSPADILLFGGAAGGGKSQLLIGLAMQEHQRSLILRREYGQLLGLTESALKMHGSRDGFVKSPEPILKTADRRTIRFGAAQHPGDEEKYQGYARDFLGLDEAAHFTELQVRTLSGWVRTEDRKQRTRVVLASNPPMSAEGQWMIDMFGPWLNPNYPRPAKPGELRWFISDETGKDQEVPSGEPVRVGGKMVSPISRTFIPSKLADNIYYVETGYEKILDAMPEPMRTAMREGNFMAFRQDDLFQVIPVAWIREAMARWTPNPPPGQRMTCMGVDVALGGADQTAIATRRGMWFAKPIVIPGAQTPSASFVVGQVTQHLRDGALVAVDVGGGYGIDTVARLKDLGLNCAGYNGAESSTASPSGSRLAFANRRAQAWWAFREALNPDNGVGVMLPPDTDLEADLTAPQWDPVAMERRGVYQVETKDQIRKRLSRSPDRGDAVVMAWFCGPSPEQEHKAIHAAKPSINLGYSHVKVNRGYGNAKSYGGRR